MNYLATFADLLFLVGLGTVGYGLYQWFGKGVMFVWVGIWLMLLGAGYYMESKE